MYLTSFNISKEEYESNAYARDCLNNFFLLHREVQSLFAKEGETGSKRSEEDALYRIEKILSNVYILIQSNSKPNPKNSQLFRDLTNSMEVKDLEEYYANLKEGGVAKFVLTCRPIVQKPNPTGGRSKKRVIRNEGKRQEWVLRKAMDAGLSVMRIKEVDACDHFVNKSVTMGSIEEIGKKKEESHKPFHVGGFSYTGILKVTDPNKAREFLKKGFGTSKPYGFGLMLLVI